jgi:hypothetical protein
VETQWARFSRNGLEIGQSLEAVMRLFLGLESIGTIDAITFRITSLSYDLRLQFRVICGVLRRPDAIGVVMKQEPVERRKYKRFRVSVGAFIVLGPDSTKLGRVTDIGLGGIGFAHVDRKEPLEGPCQFDMFHVNNGFNLKKVPFRQVWDLEFRQGLFGFGTVRRTGIAFGDLTYGQRSQVEHFILNYTTAVCLEHPELCNRLPQTHGFAPINP